MPLIFEIEASSRKVHSKIVCKCSLFLHLDIEDVIAGCFEKNLDMDPTSSNFFCENVLQAQRTGIFVICGKFINVC